MRVLFSILCGLIYDAIFSETLVLSTLAIIKILVVAAFLTPLAASRGNSRTLLLATALVAALARIPLTINLPSVRLWSSILIVGVAGMYMATLLRGRSAFFGPPCCWP